MGRTARLCLAALAPALAGCFLFGRKPADDHADLPPPTTVMVGHEFDDILVPRGFEQIAADSRIVQGAGFRSGTLRYRGALRMTTVRDWYKLNMPAKGWTQVAGAAGESGLGPYTLRFEKGDERCELLIESPAAETFLSFTLGLK